MLDTAPVPRLCPTRALLRSGTVRCALLSLAVGDALGTTLEFTERDRCPILTDMVGGGPFRLAPGEWTDDTSMALVLADTLARGGDSSLMRLAPVAIRFWQDRPMMRDVAARQKPHDPWRSRGCGCLCGLCRAAGRCD